MADIRELAAATADEFPEWQAALPAGVAEAYEGLPRQLEQSAAAFRAETGAELQRLHECPRRRGEEGNSTGRA